MELFDTHAHLSDEAFDDDRHSLIPKLFESGVTRIIDVACDVRTADRTIELIDRYPSFTEPSECIRTMFPQWIMR